MSKSAITRALKAGRLFEIHDGVYSAIEPTLLVPEAWLAAAILAGGQGARLFGHSAAHWAKLTRHAPSVIHVATRHNRAKATGIQWHRDPLLLGDQTRHRRFPITHPPLIPSEIARDLSLWDLKQVLAELEYHWGIEAGDVIVRQRAGAAKLRQAIAEHTPELAATRSELERAFARFLDERGFSQPEFNHPLGRSTVDAVFHKERIAIELDGVRGHSGERRILRDHRRDLHRRREGYTPLRYHFAQIRHDGDLIAADLIRLGIPSIA